ncbi:hypothetical protein [Streptomyces sp. CB00072]|uniref:hypothetical protein n=1 Tax=Streptomyces sp. CB00072 TaxID=1703928 RepID=UPI000AB11D8F|nr:hypothetical protein [Streptomyces sp. CB00072]
MGLMSWLRGGRSGDAPAAAPMPAADRGDRVDVNRLEPIQRVVSGQQLTVGPAEFEASLTTRQDTALGTPLGHLVSPDAPAGLVRGVGAAESAPSPSPVAAQRSVDMPVRASVTRFGRAGGPEAVPGTVSAPALVPVQRLYGGETSAMTSSVGAESGPGGGEELPVRRLVGERPVVAEPASPVPSPDPPPAPASGSVGVQRAAMPPAGERPRRAPGLGAPLPGLPPTAQRRAASGPEASGGEVPPSAPAVPGLSDDVRAEGADLPTAPLLGDDPLVGEVSRDRSDDLAGGAPASAGGAGDVGGARDAGDTGGSSSAGGAGSFVQRSDGPPSLSGPSPALPSPSAPADSGPVAPLLGDRPLVPRNVDVQRAAEPRSGPAGGSAPDPGGSASPPEGVPVRWTGAEDGGPLPGPGVSVGNAPPGATPAGPPSAFLQRRAAEGPPVPASVARSLPGSGSARRLPSAGAVAVAAGVAQRMADGSVVFGGAPVSGTSRPVVQRDSDVAEEPPPPDPDPEPDPVTEPEDRAEPGTGTEDGSGAGAAPKDGKGAPAVTDELVRALYTPLSRLLKNDLRLERERAGHLINTRH